MCKVELNTLIEKEHSGHSQCPIYKMQYNLCASTMCDYHL